MENEPGPGVCLEGRYRLVRALGEGTFGAVWLGEDERLSRRPVAVKFLKEDFFDHLQAVARFEAEADALAQVQHPNVVGVLDRGRWGRGRYLVTEFVAGQPLSKWLDAQRAHKTLPSIETVRAVFEPLCAGLAAAHAVKTPGPIVHRDIKPDNVMVRWESDGDVVVKVLDFGIARLGQRQGTQTGALMGTPLYMAPEQALGQTDSVGPATDVFSLGVVLVELLSLHARCDTDTPWWGTVLRGEATVRERLTALRQEVSPAVWEVCAAALRLDPSKRPADAGALRSAFRQAWATPAQPQTTFPPTLYAPPPSYTPPPSLPAQQYISAPEHSAPLGMPTPGPAWSASPNPLAYTPQGTLYGSAEGLQRTTAPLSLPSRPRPLGPTSLPVLVSVGLAVGLVGIAGSMALNTGTSEPDAPSARPAVATAAMGSTPVTAPVTAPTEPNAIVTPPSAQFTQCVLYKHGSFHLRPYETQASVGQAYPDGTQITVLSPGEVYRRSTQSYRVRINLDSAEGWVFLTSRELSSCSVLP